MPRPLKVFQAQFGFWDCVVAVPSQAAALRAWGTRQNLFADGEAREITEESAVAAAVAHPATPLRRAVGSSDPFSLEPRLPQMPAAVPRPPSRASAKPKLKPARARAAPPDRGALDAAEAALLRLEAERGRQQADYERRRAALESEDAAARQLYASERAGAASEVERCRKAFVAAGGRLKR